MSPVKLSFPYDFRVSGDSLVRFDSLLALMGKDAYLLAWVDGDPRKNGVDPMKPVQSRIGDFRLNAASGLAWEARKRRGKPEAPWTITAVIILAVWFGLVTGLLELGLIYTRSHVLGWSSLSALQISRHFAWMIPIANL